MDNYPPGATESWAPYNQPVDKTCPECGLEMPGENNSEKIKGRIYRWVEYTCECGYKQGEANWDKL